MFIDKNINIFNNKIITWLIYQRYIPNIYWSKLHILYHCKMNILCVELLLEQNSDGVLI